MAKKRVIPPFIRKDQPQKRKAQRDFVKLCAFVASWQKKRRWDIPGKPA
ncbi:Uncharacterized protein dnm_073340 [Desulfonema magnum]|uniref:Uncharacterized protein n=1 Tax=Desulfonema magnum TaxID=45655 RepID=A0A975BUA1_9BACT|nr:Uncharacterized protein dnm_073340 [Desulfonema magnum]